MKQGISFKTLATTPGIGGAPGRCRCNVIHTDILSRSDMAQEMAATMRMDIVEARHCMDAVCAYIVRSLARGRKLNFGEFSLSLSIRGTVDGANGEFVAGENEVRVNIQPGAELRDALAKMHPEVDAATGEENTVTTGSTTLVAGSGLLVGGAGDDAAADEGVWLEAGGVRVARGRITACGSTTLDCVFDAAIEPGEYSLAIYVRGGSGGGGGAPAKARRKVSVRRA